jgi:hypothetical protein
VRIPNEDETMTAPENRSSSGAQLALPWFGRTTPLAQVVTAISTLLVQEDSRKGGQLN